MRIYLAGALFSIAEQRFNQELKDELLKIESGSHDGPMEPK